MAVRSWRVFGPVRAPAAVATALYTVPADRTLILRSLVVYAAVGATAYYLLLNGVSGLTHGLDGPRTLAAGARQVYQEDWVLNPGDVLYAYNNNANAYVYTGFGSLLLGAPV